MQFEFESLVVSRFRKHIKRWRLNTFCVLFVQNESVECTSLPTCNIRNFRSTDFRFLVWKCHFAYRMTSTALDASKEASAM